jgi:A/G-specific adenine glycosylase
LPTSSHRIRDGAPSKDAVHAQPRAAKGFARKLVDWQRRHGRHDLPWQGSRDPYRVWLSEIMLQQTQVGTVVAYYRRFLARFPDVASLAAASLDDVMRLWAGLGYYSRARNLHRAAGAIMQDHRGIFPKDRSALEALPGVGRSTAAAVAAFAFGAREAILDGNVKRVLARHFAVDGFPGDSAVQKVLWSLAESLVPPRSVETYTQALMDLGATVCKRTSPDCGQCPLAASCAARARGRTQDYPRPRPRRSPRVRSVVMLLLLREGRILLQKRPRSGIWGGLWSLPEIEVDGDIPGHCAVQLGCEVRKSVALPPLRHAFTHFTLDIRPRLCEVGRLLPRARQQDGAWFVLVQATDAGVPAPVNKLLRSLMRGAREGSR